jgi:hypothetical protein
VTTALLACASVIGSVRPACAQSELVLLLVPQTPEPALVELFHRVEAELRLHDFRPEVLVATPEDSTESLLGAQASAKRAFAAIEIVEQTPYAMLHVWIVDARTGLTKEYRVEQRGGQEPTNVVAVRAVDLLRANRAPPPSAAATEGGTPPTAAGPTRESSDGGATGSAAAQGAASAQKARRNADGGDGKQRGSDGDRGDDERERDDSERARDRGDADDAASEERDDDDDDEAPSFGNSDLPSTFRYTPTLLQVAVEFTGLSLSRRLSWSFGPSIGAWLTLDRFRIGIVGVAPLWGAVLHAPLGDPTIWQELLWLELGARLVRAGPLQLSAAAGGGLHWLQAKARAVQYPYQAKDDANWSWTVSLAGRADVMLAQHWSLGFTLRARIFLPPVEVAVAEESARLATPALEGALGLSFWL